MLVIGIDPGTATTGYGVVKTNGKLYEMISFGLIETGKELLPEVRLSSIFNDIGSLLEMYKPDVLAIEKIFFANNAKTAIRVGQAQGVIMLSAASYKIPIVEYSPMTIKKIIAGSGRADKDFVRKSVRKILGSKIRTPKNKKTHFDDACDALAIAICHINCLRDLGKGVKVNGGV